ncbi:cadherin-related family member 3-like [Lethenteron reissneri]|uniref:cadherin-related family member 3-like n=1 Tax=Lethenteron reissneri TaxID=7753 RepID=UPI002AB6098F|nr:cadherin-related family member 3-like [Lethenteron reissneri]
MMERRKKGPTSCDLLKILIFTVIGFAKEGDGILTFGSSLPKIVTLQENSAPSATVYTFTVRSTNILSIAGPIFFNPNPASHPFQIIPIGSITPAPFSYTYKVAVSSNSPVLDYESQSFYTLPIYVTDINGIYVMDVLTVNITDVNEAPEFLDSLGLQTLTLYVPENSNIYVLYQVLVWDPDNDVCTFLCSPNTDFDITSLGGLTTKKSFNYEIDFTNYTLNIIVSDGRGLSVNGTVLIFIENINDNSPSFTNVVAHNVTIPEELALSTLITTLSATDVDNLGLLTFSIDTATGYLSVDAATGEVMLSKRMNLEGNCPPSLLFTIKVCDDGNKCDISTLTVKVTDINDNPPVCVAPYSIDINENQAPISVLTNVICTDIDFTAVNQAFSFSMTNVGSAASNLAINATGAIELRTGTFDYENLVNLFNGYTYLLTVVATNTATPFLRATVTVYLRIIPVNEFTPQFNSTTYQFVIAETASAGAILGKVQATDQDFLLNDITYRLRGPGVGRFLIEPTGNIKAITKLDYELVQRYELVAEAVDGDPFFPKTATVTVTVIVVEENDEPPVCNPLLARLTLTDAVTVGTNIQGFALTCTDADSAADELRYDISSGNINNHFGFSPTRGSNSPRLLLMRLFDYKGQVDTVQNFRLEVHVIDDNKRNVSAQTGTAIILVTVVRTGTTARPLTALSDKPGVVLRRTSVNTYDWSEWYVPFLITLGSLLLAGLLAFLLYRLFKSKAFRSCLRSCCSSRNKPARLPPVKAAEKKKVEFVQEITKINTVFDGEAIDPVTGKTYEYNSTSGARRWKETSAQAPPPAPAKTPAPATASTGTAPAPTGAQAAIPGKAPAAPAAAPAAAAAAGPAAAAAAPAVAPPPAAAVARAGPPATVARAAPPPAAAPSPAAAAPATKPAQANSPQAPPKSSMKAEPSKPSDPRKPDKPNR